MAVSSSTLRTPCRLFLILSMVRTLHAWEVPEPATSDRLLVLDDIPFLDPMGSAAMHMHEQGLRPSGRGTAEDPPQDPLLFSHRYQHHDEATNRLIYYQYEARHHPHVVNLEDLGVRSCEVTRQNDAPNITAITLEFEDRRSASSLGPGVVVLGHELGCVSRAADGTTLPWRSTLRERVVGLTRRSATDTLVTLMTVSAALNEVFEHAQLEYYHGHPHKLDTSRNKRLESLASNGHKDEGIRYNFASSATVLADARAVAVSQQRRQLAETSRFKPSNKKEPAPSAHNSSSGRQLSHDCSCLFCSGKKNDINLKLSGSNCNTPGIDRPGPGMEKDNCYWKTVQNGRTTYALKAGNEYKLKWTSGTSESQVEIFILEDRE